jgi:hypothetical protein
MQDQGRFCPTILKHIGALHPFFTCEILPKSKIQNSKFKKKKVLLKVSDRQK